LVQQRFLILVPWKKRRPVASYATLDRQIEQIIITLKDDDPFMLE
jgi:hypothetical protein